MSNIPKYIRVMRQRKYDLNKVLPKLIQSITNKNQSNNECFSYYGYDITLQSGTRDYVDVSIKDPQVRYNILEFNFDFWTKELDVTFSKEDKYYDTLANSLHNLYGYLAITVE